MRHTPLTDAIIADINSTLDMLLYLTDELTLYPEGSPEIIDLFRSHADGLKRINLNNIKEEFWDLSNEFKDPVRLKNIYKVKFKNLLNWNKNQKFDFKFVLSQGDDVLTPFLIRHTDMNITFENEDIFRISLLFLSVITAINTFKTDIESLLEQCDAYAGLEEGDKSKDTEKNNTLRFRIASKRKTDFIKLLSSMYDTKMFVDADDKPVTSKQKLMEAFGEFLGDDFSAYSASLSQAKTRDEKTFMKPFREIEKEAMRYFNQVEG